jgi:hypothetical protein
MEGSKNLTKMPKESDTKTLNFDVSTGLKRVLGRELITDDEVAIFELVKNSFDAGADTVNLYFGDANVVVADNGSGMSFNDLTDKWLFVAYSSKRQNGPGKDFRDVAAERRNFAGSKGIGPPWDIQLQAPAVLPAEGRGATLKGTLLCRAQCGAPHLRKYAAGPRLSRCPSTRRAEPDQTAAGFRLASSRPPPTGCALHIQLRRGTRRQRMCQRRVARRTRKRRLFFPECPAGEQRQSAPHDRGRA